MCGGKGGSDAKLLYVPLGEGGGAPAQSKELGRGPSGIGSTF
jgi:hypothetical protein